MSMTKTTTSQRSRFELLVRPNFTTGEWEQLQREALFRLATQAIRTISDAASVTRLGKKLISVSKSRRRRSRTGRAPVKKVAL
jgi:hypothetical protein